MLPQDRATVRSVENVGSQSPISFKDEQTGRQDWEDDQHHDRGDENVPGKDRHPKHRHAGGTHEDDRRHEVDGTKDGRQTEKVQTHHPQVSANSRGVNRIRQRSVGEPAEAGSATGGEETATGHQGAEQVQPVRKLVNARERDVGGADLKRHEVVREPGEQRGGEHQQHDCAVHREELVEGLLVHELHARISQLGSNEKRKDTAEGKKEQRRTEVQSADLLVVGSRHVIPHESTEASRAPLLAGSCGRYGDGRAGHFCSPSFDSLVVSAATEFAGLISPMSP